MFSLVFGCVIEEGVHLSSSFLSEGVCGAKNGSCLSVDDEEGMLIFTFCLTVVVTLLLTITFTFNHLDDVERACDSLWMCMITVLSHGLRSGGGVGDVLRKPSKGVHTDFFYHLLVVCIRASFLLLFTVTVKSITV